MQISKADLKSKVNQRWHAGIDGLHMHFNQYPEKQLPPKFFPKSAALDPAWYRSHLEEIREAIHEGKIFDDTDDPLPRPK